jgi:methyl-galactoside transport system permease protein
MIALLVMVIIIMIIQPRFMQIQVLLDILTQSSTKMIVALGICFTLLIAGTDLSAGRMVGLAAVVSTSMLQIPTYANRFFPDLPHLAVIIPIVLAVLACAIFGTVNGFLVAKFDMHPFIATLAVQVIVYGATSLYFDLPPNKSQPIGGIRPDFIAIGQTKILQIGGFPGISILVPIAIFFTILIWFVLNKTVFGKNVYAIGGNREAAVVSGVNVFKTIMGIFILASVLYGVAGVLEAARTAGATNNYGNGYELDAIAACVVGGVSLNGGIGKIGGIVSGVLIFTVIQYGLQFIAVSPMWQQVIKGIIIAVAVAIDLSKYRKK